MAVDTAQKRFSMITIDNFNEVLFQVDGAVDVDDRAHLVGLYSGIALDPPGDFPMVTDPSVNILQLDAGSDLTNWVGLEGASKTATEVTFVQEPSGVPGRVEFQFVVDRFVLDTPHHFTGFLIPDTLNYPHTDVQYFVRNDTTGITKKRPMVFGNHVDKGGQVEIGERKPFNMTFYAKELGDQFTVGFENFANDQLGCVFEVSEACVFIVI